MLRPLGDARARKSILTIAASRRFASGRPISERAPIRSHKATTAALSPLAGKPVPKDKLVDPALVERGYLAREPDLSDGGQSISFGTSGHRRSPLAGWLTRWGAAPRSTTELTR